MTGTQCDNCKKMQTIHEDLSPTRSRSTWMSVSRRGVTDNLDFCCKECLLVYVSQNFHGKEES